MFRFDCQTAKLRRPVRAGRRMPLSIFRRPEGSRAPTGAGAESAAPRDPPRGKVDLRIAGDRRPATQAGAPLDALLRRFSLRHRAALSPMVQSVPIAVSQLLAGGRCTSGRSPDAARVPTILRNSHSAIGRLESARELPSTRTLVPSRESDGRGSVDERREAEDRSSEVVARMKRSEMRGRSLGPGLRFAPSGLRRLQAMRPPNKKHPLSHLTTVKR